ncbi:MAG TPA: 3-oxoacyl-ACP synthase III family protein [Candidatus Kapabacteria bacterium]|nr:3-oxoacyl-ACP synthase III family protein [Candidatus Kapabacteria bacterium]
MQTPKSAGLISMGGYLPAKEVPENRRRELVEFLKKETQLYPEYIAEIQEKGHLPGRVETNYEGWESQPWFDAWLKNLSTKKREDPFQGTKERRLVPMDPISLKNSIIPHPMISSDAETLAGALAIFNGGIDKDEIDLVLCSTLVMDISVPLNASLIQHKLGLNNAGAYNVDTCCSSFITMLEIAMTYVKNGLKNKVLVVASAIQSIVRDKSDYYSVYVGDGALAGIVGEVPENYGYLASHSTSHGNRHKGIILHKRRPSLYIPTSQSPTLEQEFVTFYDLDLCKEIAQNAQTDLADVVNKTLVKSGHTVPDIDFFITHQPVKWTAHAWREAVGVPLSRFYESFDKYGNIANASVPTNFLEAVEQGLIKEGDKVMVASAGAGENHIALFQRVPPSLIKNNKL